MAKSFSGISFKGDKSETFVPEQINFVSAMPCNGNKSDNSKDTTDSPFNPTKARTGEISVTSLV